MWNLLNSVQDKNPYMYSHPVNVAFISYEIGKWMNLDESKLQNLVRAGLLHDIGKSKIKDSLLNKTDTLTWEEMEVMKSHPIIGYKLLDSVKLFDSEVLQGVLCHHERMDGSGYLGLKGEKINLISRIIAIADTYDAITANKTYRPKHSPLKAMEEIQANSLKLLDQDICQLYVNKMIEYYKGSTIRLSNEKIGQIVKMNPVMISKPIVRCDNEDYDLSEEIDLEIIEFLS